MAINYDLIKAFPEQSKGGDSNEKIMAVVDTLDPVIDALESAIKRADVYGNIDEIRTGLVQAARSLRAIPVQVNYDL